MNAHIRSLAVAAMLVYFAFDLLAQTPGKSVAAIPDSPTENAAVTNTIGLDIASTITTCKLTEGHHYTRGFVAHLRKRRPDLVEFLSVLMEGAKASTRIDRGYPEKFSSAALVVVDPNNKVPFNRDNWDSYIAGLCALALGNEANIVVLDMTTFSAADKKLVRETLSAKLGPRMKDQKDREGKPMDLDKLLTERQVNTIGLVALDASRPQVLTPIHSADARYQDIVGGLMKKALARMALR